MLMSNLNAPLPTPPHIVAEVSVMCANHGSCSYTSIPVSAVLVAGDVTRDKKAALPVEAHFYKKYYSLETQLHIKKYQLILYDLFKPSYQ